MKPTSRSRPRRRDNRHHRRHIDVIRRRIAWLDTRIDNYDAKGDPARDRAERAALCWALEIVEEWIAADPLNELDPAQNG